MTGTHVVLILMSGVAMVRGGTVIDADFLSDSPAGVDVPESVEPVPGKAGARALSFAGDGLRIPLTGALLPSAGTVSVTCRIPEPWPGRERGTLFHIGDMPHTHVTLFTTAGALNAVYKSDVDHYSAVQYPESRSWRPGTWHSIEFSWRAEESRIYFHLQVDGQFVGFARGQQIADWPAHGYVGVRRKVDPWGGLIQSMELLPEYVAPSGFDSGRKAVQVNADNAIGECYRFWSTGNFTSQDRFVDPDFAERMRITRPRMRFVNCVRLLGGRNDEKNQWFKGANEDGSVECDFSGMIEYLKGIVAAGYTPRIVLDNVPTAMSNTDELHVYGNTAPAEDLNVWHEYIAKAVEAMVAEFGLDTVKSWRFRVGTEPDLFPNHWRGTKDEYLRHYDCTVDAVTGVIPDAEIGPGNILNPARHGANASSERNAWGLDIVDHCATGKNTWTGRTGSRMCFLQCSWYGRVGKPIVSFAKAVGLMRGRLDRYPKFRDIPVSIAEFAVLQDENGRRLWSGDATEWGASWYAAIADRVYSLNVEHVYEWSQTTAGIPHPRLRVIEMLEEMTGGVLLETDSGTDTNTSCGAIACRKDGEYYVLLYNHYPWREPHISREMDLEFRGGAFSGGEVWDVKGRFVDAGHGVFIRELYRDCRKNGLEPVSESAPLYGGDPSRRFGPKVRELIHRNRGKYLELSRPGVSSDDGPVTSEQNSLRLNLVLPGHSVYLIRLRGAP